MNNLVKFIALLAITLGFFSCSDEFLDEKLVVSGVSTSAIIISPSWEADNYQFKCKEITNGVFNIIEKPDWLILDNSSGTINDNIATFKASAVIDPYFSKVGFYVDQIVISSGDKKYAIPVYYLNEGNPTVQVNNTFEFSCSTYHNKVRITNSGDGILLWDIISVPSWLQVSTNQIDGKSLTLGKGSTAVVPFVHDTWTSAQGNLTGNIVLKTNDKNNPIVEIAVSAIIGTPNITIVDEKLSMNYMELKKTVRIYNYGDGILRWNFEYLPEWLSVSHTSGMFLSYSSSNVTFTCDRSKLKSGVNTATIKLKSNDPVKPSVDLVVEYI